MRKRFATPATLLSGRRPSAYTRKHTTPAIAQLAEHLTVEHAAIRWSLVRFRVAGFFAGRRDDAGVSTRTLSDVGRSLQSARRAHPDLNQGPADLQSAAPTTELCTRLQASAAETLMTDTATTTCAQNTRRFVNNTCVTADSCIANIPSRPFGYDQV